MWRERSSQASSFTHDFKIWFKRSHNLTSDWAICFLCPQSSRDHLGSAFLWGHRHVVPGLCDSWALPGMAPLPRSLRVRSGNVWFELMNRWWLCIECLYTHRLICCYFCMCMNENCACLCSLFMNVDWMCLGRWDASPWNPPDSAWWFLRSLPVYLNRCHRATCPISAAPVLQSKTLSCSSLAIAQMRHSGDTLNKLCSISISNKLFWFLTKPKTYPASFTSLKSVLAS